MPVRARFAALVTALALTPAADAAVSPKGGTQPDIATSVSVAPYPSAGSLLRIDTTYTNTPTAGTEAVFDVVLSQPWGMHSSSCGFSVHAPGHVRAVFDIDQGETVECWVRLKIPETYTGALTVDAQAVSLEDPNVANNADQATAQVVRLRVNTTSDGFDATPGDGLCRHGDGLPICSLRAALIEANALPGLQTVEVPWSSASYALTREGVDTEYFGDLDVTDSVVISGRANAEGLRPTVAATFASGVHRVLDIDVPGGSARVQGLQLVGLEQPVSGHGGVLRHLAGDLSLIDATLSGGVASERGGGLYLGDTAALLRVRVVDNGAGDGAGIAAVLPPDTFVEIRDSAITGNIAATSLSNGGGLYIDGGRVFLERVLLSHNHADEGGAVFALDTELDVVNTTLSTNTAGSNGGGLFTAFAQVRVHYSTIAHNAAAPGDNEDGLGGGIYIGTSTSVEIGSSILTGNTAQTRSTTSGGTPPFTITTPWAAACFGSPASTGYNSVQGTSTDPQCTWTATEGDVVNATALIGALADNGGFSATHALLEAAQEIDSGNPGCTGVNGASVWWDQRGIFRPFDGDGIDGARCDKGAYEHVPPAVVTVVKQGSGDGTVVSDPAGIHCGATCSVEFANGEVVTLMPSQGPGSTFVGWSGPCTGTGHCVVTAQPGMTEVVANFTQSTSDAHVFGDGFE